MSQHLLFNGMVGVLVISKVKILVMAIPPIAVTNNVIKQIGVQTLLFKMVINIVHFLLQDALKIRHIHGLCFTKNHNNSTLKIQRHSQ